VECIAYTVKFILYSDYIDTVNWRREEIPRISKNLSDFYINLMLYRNFALCMYTYELKMHIVQHVYHWTMILVVLPCVQTISIVMKYFYKNKDFSVYINSVGFCLNWYEGIFKVLHVLLLIISLNNFQQIGVDVLNPAVFCRSHNNSTPIDEQRYM